MQLGESGSFARLTWDELWMNSAVLLSMRSACTHYKVGAVFVSEDGKQRLVEGYNGPPSGDSHCDEIGCAKLDKSGKLMETYSRKCRGGHAEMNTLANSVREGIEAKNCIIYCTYSPCRECLKVLIRLDIKEFVFLKEYRSDFSEVKGVFEKRGIKFRQFQGRIFVNDQSYRF